MKKIILALFIIIMATGVSEAQIDTEFWFGAPDATMGTPNEIANPNGRRDKPIRLVISTLDQPSTVRILQPANLSFTPIQITIPANQTQQIDLTLFLDIIETRPANEVLNSGILVRASTPITAYYEIESVNNTDIFTLKGRNANGKQFYTPFQSSYENATNLTGALYIPQPRSGFIVVATTDSTTVNITPSIDMLGHPGGETYSIFLMRGQTYYGESTGPLANEHAFGTYIESDKDIAVTVKDDMIDRDISNTSGADIAGDQMIALEQTGNEHIIIRGTVEFNGDRAYILATEDNTTITIGEEAPVIIDQGEQVTYEFTDESAYILSDKNVFVWHISGNGSQLAGAAVPPLNCTGSNQVGFFRIAGNFFALNITIRSGSEDSFILNGDPTLVPASAFSPVPGSNDEYVFARIDLTSEIPEDTPLLLTNFSDELFHLGVTSATGSNGCNYGYFTNFTYLNLGSNKEVCLGDSVTLDAGPGKTSYSWNTGDTTQSVVVHDPGMYIVETFSGTDCYAIDTIMVSNYEPPIDLGPTDTICSGSSVTLNVEGSYLFEWQDGSTGSSFTAESEGFYYVDVEDFQGCRTRDSIYIAESPRPITPVISGDSLYCAGETIELSFDPLDNAFYRFKDPEGNIIVGNNLSIDNIQVSDSGDYKAYYVVDGCESFEDTLNIQVNPSPQFEFGPDQFLCVTDTINLEPNVEGTYMWQDGSSDTTYTVTESGSYTLEVVNAFSCTHSDTVDFTFSPQPPAPVISGETTYCEGESIDISIAEMEDMNYVFEAPNGELFTDFNLLIEEAAIADSGQYTAQYILFGCESPLTTFEIVINELPEFDLGEDDSFCGDTPFTIEPNAGAGDYLWQDGSTDTEYEVNSTGTYILEVTNPEGCTFTDSVHYEFTPFPEVPVILGDPTVCVGDSIILYIDSQEGISYGWNTPGDVILTQNSITVVSADSSNSGTYTVYAILNDCNSDPAQINVEVIANPEFSLGEDLIICDDSTVILSAGTFDSYDWSTGETTSSIEAAQGNYSVQVSNSEGCTTSDSIVISGSGLTADFSFFPNTDLQANTIIEFTDESFSELSDIDSWFWSFAEFGNKTEQDPFYSFPSAGTHPVTLLVTDDLGCTDDITFDVVISFEMLIPEVFSPNGDGRNDYFFIRGLDAQRQAKIAIFNRWGSVVFEADRYLNNWDAKDLPDGVYFYILEVNNGENISGNVTVTR